MSDGTLKQILVMASVLNVPENITPIWTSTMIDCQILWGMEKSNQQTYVQKFDPSVLSRVIEYYQQILKSGKILSQITAMAIRLFLRRSWKTILS